MNIQFRRDNRGGSPITGAAFNTGKRGDNNPVNNVVKSSGKV